MFTPRRLWISRADGEFKVNANDKVGSGYWTHAFSSGQTIYLTRNKRTAFSAFQMYEFHTEQEGTQIQPGQTLDLDFSGLLVSALGRD